MSNQFDSTAAGFLKECGTTPTFSPSRLSAQFHVCLPSQGGCLKTYACGVEITLPSISHGAEDNTQSDNCENFVGCTVSGQRPDGNPTYSSLDISDLLFDADDWDVLRNASKCGEVGRAIVQLRDGGGNVTNHGIEGWFSDVSATISRTSNSTQSISWQPSEDVVRLEDGDLPTSLFCTDDAVEVVKEKVSRKPAA